MSINIDVIVSSVRAIARDILAVELKPKSGDVLPDAEPGAHIDIALPNGMVRQYSLTNATGGKPLSSYTVGIGRDANSRGGSAWIHDKLRTGQSLRISEPRNLFSMNPEHKKVLLLAGGIGITPIYAMAQFCLREGLECEIWACARSPSRLAYLEELKALDRVTLLTHFDDEECGPIDLQPRLKSQNWDAVYACGPAPMLDALSEATSHWPENAVRMERFKVPEADTEDGESFELVLVATGITLTVDAQETVLEAIERVGVDVPWSCREGICGTCEARVLEGEIDHRDYVLSPQERDAQDRMLICVSRCAGKRLVLDA